MYELYDSIPFGVMILKVETLKVAYINNRFKSNFNISGDIIGRELSNFILPNVVINTICNCKYNDSETYLREVEVYPDIFMDININIIGDSIQIFTSKIDTSNTPLMETNKNIIDNFIINTNILESFAHFVCITDKNGDIKYMNQKAYHSLEEFGIRELQNLFHIIKHCNLYDNNSRLLEIKDLPLYKTLETGICSVDKILLCNINCVDKYIKTTTIPITKDDCIIGAMCIWSDITESYIDTLKQRKEREKFLALSTEFKTKCYIIEILRKREKEHLMHLKDVINNISEGILVIDNNHKITLCNNAVCNILNLKQIELLDYNNIERKYTITPEYAESKSLREFFRDYHMKNIPIKNLVLKLEEIGKGHIKYIEYNSNPIIKSNGKLIYTIITLKDITDKKLNEIYAAEQAQFVKNVLNTLDVPISVLDYPGFTGRLLNKKFEQILCSVFNEKYSAKNIVGNNILNVFSEYKNREFIKQLLKVVESNKEVILPPLSVKSIENKEKYYKMRITPYKIKNDGMRIYIHGVDVTEEVNHNHQLEKINKMKDEFLTIISHELRTPLTIIYSSLQLAYNIYGKEITPNIDKTFNRIKQNCSRLLKLTNNIMDISKAEEEMLCVNNKEFDVVMETERIVNLVNSYGVTKGLDIIFDTNEEECKVVIDKEKYERILLNLLSNAIKYTPHNKHIYVYIDVKKDYFTLTIKDEGIGIPENKIDSIFDRCTQIDSTLSRGAEGLGLGLTVVKKFVEAMKGSIYVKSKESEGSEFIVVLDKHSKISNSISSWATLSDNFVDIVNIEMSDIN
ncbi:ATP-binding protein [Clostridium lundense]|uniref:PAS domain-containing sensor histidine kinase n=1 Tax=Clostridium lundense TaxID=319475 RepID=UPI000AB69072|nr:ATP-binding protein [Clostridium lundense]